MIELKKDINEALDKLNMAWVEAVKEGSEPNSDGIDLTDVMSKFSEVNKDMDEKFNQAMLRLKNKKGKGFFG